MKRRLFFQAVSGWASGTDVPPITAFAAGAALRCDCYGLPSPSCSNTLTLVRLSVSRAAERVVCAALSNIYGVMGCAEDPGLVGKTPGSGLAACPGGGYLEIQTLQFNL